MSWWTKLKELPITKFFNASHNLPLETWQELEKAAFERAKRTSDLVSMVTRLVFCYFAVGYFWTLIFPLGTFDSWVGWACLTITVPVTIKMQWQILTIASFNLLRDTTYTHKAWTRIACFVSCCAIMAAFSRGLYLLVYSLAKVAGIK